MSNDTGDLAPYGRACLNCARAKTKCVISNVGFSKCERYAQKYVHLHGLTCRRCRRLNKECQAPLPTRKRKAPSRNSPTESRRLEQKLDGLYSLLASQGSSPTVFNTSHPALSLSTASSQSHPPSSRIENAHVPSPATSSQVYDASCNQTQTLTPATSNDAALSPVRSPVTVMASTFDPSPRQAQELLEFFRNYMLPFLPFMTMPLSKTARELRQEYPFLWLCIMAITSRSSSQQTALNRAVRTNLGRLMLVEGEKTLDLLYGTITCVAWYGQGQSTSRFPRRCSLTIL